MPGVSAKEPRSLGESTLVLLQPKTGLMLQQQYASSHNDGDMLHTQASSCSRGPQNNSEMPNTRATAAHYKNQKIKSPTLSRGVNSQAMTLMKKAAVI